MGGRLIPPTDELCSPLYAKSPDGSDMWWRNIFENPTAVQFDHRVLVCGGFILTRINDLCLECRQAMTTYLSTALLYASTFRPALRAILPPMTRMNAAAAFAMANLQVLLGISTLIYLVPVPVAAAHQAGSVALLSAMVHLLVTLRKPGMAARMWRQAYSKAKNTGSC